MRKQAQERLEINSDFALDEDFSAPANRKLITIFSPSKEKRFPPASREKKLLGRGLARVLIVGHAPFAADSSNWKNSVKTFFSDLFTQKIKSKPTSGVDSRLFEADSPEPWTQSKKRKNFRDREFRKIIKMTFSTISAFYFGA